MNETAQNRSNERPYFWLGAAIHNDPELVNLLNPRVPLIVVDSTDIDE